MDFKNARRVAAVGIAVAMLAIVGCGSSSTSSKSSTSTSSTTTATTAPAASTTSASSTGTTATMTKEQAGKAYLAAVAPANDAIQTFNTKAKGWTDSTTASQAAADAKPVGVALTTLRTKLLALAGEYPAAATDLKALVNAYAPLQGDLASLAAVNQLSAASFVQQYAKDASATGSAAAIVRSDVGLPPGPTSS